MFNLEGIDITKLTIAGSNEQIIAMNKYIRENLKGYKTHMGKTSFPNKDKNNYRMDFTGMHSKGDAAKLLKEELGLDTCIYLGNDLNDVTMFSNAIDDDDFIVIANNEYKNITKMLIEYLKKEYELKGKEWEDAKLLVLEDQNVNNFLNRISKILAVLNSKKESKNIRKKYVVEPVKPKMKDIYKNRINSRKRKKVHDRFN